MRILLTVHQFLPDFRAGTEILTLSVARVLIASGHEVAVLAGHPNRADLTDDKRLEEYRYENIPVYRFNHAFSPMGGQSSRMELEYNNSLAARYFRQILQSFKPDLVHFFHFGRLGTALIDEAIALNVPAFFTPTDFWTICPNGRLTYSDGTNCSGPIRGAGNCAIHLAVQKLGPTVERLVARIPNSISETMAGIAKSAIMPVSSIREDLKAIEKRLPINILRLSSLNHIVAPNRMIESCLIEHGVPASIITRAAYGIDLELSRIAKPKVRSLVLRVGFIGTLARHKGCHTLIDAFNTFDNNLATLKIYGNELDFPEYSKALRDKSKNNPSISFNGTFPNSEISKILAEIDVLVVPSAWPENTPLIIYSAQAARCPIVASNVPGIAEAIRHGVDGLLFGQGDHRDLASCLQRLIREPRLIDELSANISPPRSTFDYVDDLLNIWVKRYSDNSHRTLSPEHREK